MCKRIRKGIEVVLCFAHGRQPENLLADLLVAPGVALQPLPPDSNHVQVGNTTDLQFKAELGSPTWVSDLSSQDIALLLTSNALKNIRMILMLDGENRR